MTNSPSAPPLPHTHAHMPAPFTPLHCFTHHQWPLHLFCTRLSLALSPSLAFFPIPPTALPSSSPSRLAHTSFPPFLPIPIDPGRPSLLVCTCLSALPTGIRLDEGRARKATQRLPLSPEIDVETRRPESPMLPSSGAFALFSPRPHAPAPTLALALAPLFSKLHDCSLKPNRSSPPPNRSTAFKRARTYHGHRRPVPLPGALCRPLCRPFSHFLPPFAPYRSLLPLSLPPLVVVRPSTPLHLSCQRLPTDASPLLATFSAAVRPSSSWPSFIAGSFATALFFAFSARYPPCVALFHIACLLCHAKVAFVIFAPFPFSFSNVSSPHVGTTQAERKGTSKAPFGAPTCRPRGAATRVFATRARSAGAHEANNPRPKRPRDVAGEGCSHDVAERSGGPRRAL